MRRKNLVTVSFLVCLTIIFSLLSSASGASMQEYDVAQLQQQTAKLDLVILLDNSGSMYVNQSGGNDPLSYRYDAASIMLNMCESEGTYAAVFEFNQVPKGIVYDQLTSIDTTGKARIAMTEQLTKRVQDTSGKNGNGPTYLGTALEKAVSVLDAGKEARQTSNRAPIILLMADGNCDERDQDKLNSAKKDCIEKGYKIYTIPLIGKGETKFDIDALRNLAKDTGGRAFDLYDAAELPTMFAQVFADQIGAEMTYKTKMPTEVGDGLWEVEFSIPNTAVSECNIMVPTANLDDIQLFRPNSDVPIVKDDITDNIDYYACGLTPGRDGTIGHNQKKPRFEQYKITTPILKDRDLGKWHMRFKADDAKSAQNVSITIVFNYNLTMKTNLADANSEINCNKGDRFDLVAKFYTPDDKPYSRDDTLYLGKTEGDDETGITCTAYLFSKPDDEINELTPVMNLDANPGELQFDKKNFNISDFGIRSSDYISGDYYILLKAQGDGMIRTADMIHIHVSNQKPEKIKDHAGIKLSIQNPLDMEKAEGTTISIDEYLHDPDGDFDIKSIGQEGIDDQTIATCNIEKSDPAHATAKIITAGSTGETSFHITMTDYEDSQETITIPILVKSILEQLKDGYSLDLTASQPAKGQEATTYEKGEVVTLTVEYKRGDSADPDYRLEDYQPTIDLFQIKAGEENPVLLKEKMHSGDNYQVNLEGEDAGIYSYKAVLHAGEQEITESELLPLSTENMVPKVISDTNWSSDAEIGCEQIPDKWLGYQNTEPWEIYFNEMIMDPNGDYISFEYKTEPDPQNVADIEQLQENGDLIGLRITPKTEGTLKLLITATDDYSESNPGKLENLEYRIQVTDRHAITIKYALLILAGIVLLLIIIRIIWAITRPKFRNVSLEVSVNSAPQKEYPLTEDIKKNSMSKYVPAGFKFTPGMGAAMIIKPAKEGAMIQIKKANLLNGVTLSINGKPVGKSKKILLRRNNAELKATCEGEGMTWKLKSTAGPKPGAAARVSPDRKATAPSTSSGRSSSPSYH